MNKEFQRFTQQYTSDVTSDAPFRHGTIIYKQSSMSLNLSVCARDGRFGSKVGQIGPRGDRSGTFSDQISVHFRSLSQHVLKLILNSPNILSQFVLIWPTLDPNLPSLHECDIPTNKISFYTSLLGLLAVPAPKVMKLSKLKLSPLESMTDEVKEFERTEKLQLEYALLWWLGRISLQTWDHLGYKGQ